jgi:hypothetical protein
LLIGQLLISIPMKNNSQQLFENLVGGSIKKLK